MSCETFDCAVGGNTREWILTCDRARNYDRRWKSTHLISINQFFYHNFEHEEDVDRINLYLFLAFYVVNLMKEAHIDVTSIEYEYANVK